MNLFKRDFVCGKLALSRWQSYSIFPATGLHLIKERDVLAELNRSRRHMPPFTMVPDLMTAEDMEKLTGVPARRFSAWTRRKRNPLPHVRFNSHVIRFSRREVCEWIEEVNG